MTLTQGSIKSLRIKKKTARARKQNRPLPNWYRFKTDNKIR
jgi:large subunit ribosomal protein L39e